jgi:hypothetical protein
VNRFIVCLHDATPAYAGETRTMISELAPLVGRRLSVGVVPDWRGQWPLAAHPDYCRLIDEGAEELLLHGYFHRRARGSGAVTWLAEGSDEMRGMDLDETRVTLERGQRVFADVFGERARGFVAPAWQRGHVRPGEVTLPGLEHIVGFFSLDSADGRKVPLATWSWDCGRWSWLGHVGHGIGWLSQSLDRGVPALAVHPRDLHRRFWPTILRLVRELLDRGYEPTTPAALLQASDVEVAA